jgi:hypothetical protein
LRWVRNRPAAMTWIEIRASRPGILRLLGHQLPKPPFGAEADF